MPASTSPAAQSPITVVSSPTRSVFPPIADYAFLADCENTCLIAPNGAVEWMCLPWPDSPAGQPPTHPAQLT